MAIHAIVRQIAEQLRGHIPVSDDKGYASLYPFDSSIDYYINPTIAFTDPRNGKEYMLDYKDDEDRLAQLKKINTAITTYNKVAMKNHSEVLSKVPADSKVYSAKELGFTKPTLTISEHPLWAFTVMGRTKKGDGYDDIKMIAIDNEKLYRLRIELNNDSEFIAHLNRLIFNNIQIKRKESEKMGTWDSDNIWYKPNQRFHKWFQINNISVENNVRKGGRPPGKRNSSTIKRYNWIRDKYYLLKKKNIAHTYEEYARLIRSELIEKSPEAFDGAQYSLSTIVDIIKKQKWGD